MVNRYTHTVDPDQIVYPHPSDLPKSVTVRGKRYDRAWTFLKKKDAFARKEYYRSNDALPMDAVIKKDQHGWYSVYVRKREAKVGKTRAKVARNQRVKTYDVYHYDIWGAHHFVTEAKNKEEIYERAREQGYKRSQVEAFERR